MTLAPGGARRRAVDGVLLLDKPDGLSSNTVLQRVRRLYGAARAGHAGTLDPLATGLLVVCFGEATKFAQLPTDADKTYDARIALGVSTSTADAEGEPISVTPVTCTPPEVERAARALTGTQVQRPPRYSALKFKGRPYYEYARAGIEIPLPERTIAVHAFDVTAVDLPEVRARIRCSKGTYIRTLAEDLGGRLGCGAHLAALRRLAVGRFRLEQAVTVEAIEALREERRARLLLPVTALLADLPTLRVAIGDERRLVQGLRVTAECEGLVALVGPAGRLLGTGVGEAGWVRPVRLLAQERHA